MSWVSWAGVPIAGVIWQHIHYIVGLQRLGHDVYYIEDSARFAYNPITFDLNEDYSYAARILAKLASSLGLSSRWGLLRAISSGTRLRWL